MFNTNKISTPPAYKLNSAWSKLKEIGSTLLDEDSPKAPLAGQNSPDTSHLIIYRSESSWKSLVSLYVVSPTSPDAKLFVVQVHDFSTLHFTLLETISLPPSVSPELTSLSPHPDFAATADKVRKHSEQKTKKQEKGQETFRNALVSHEKPLVRTVMLKNFGGAAGAYDLQMLYTAIGDVSKTHFGGDTETWAPTSQSLESSTSQKASRMQIVRNQKHKLEFTGVLYPTSRYKWRKKSSLYQCEDEAGVIVATWKRSDSLSRKHGELIAHWNKYKDDPNLLLASAIFLELYYYAKDESLLDDVVEEVVGMVIGM